MLAKFIVLTSTFLAKIVCGQQVGTQVPENHPPFNWEQCTIDADCSIQTGGVVLDANWRWVHSVNSTDDCFNIGWNASLCPDDISCATNCALEGANYADDYGISTSGNEITLQYSSASENLYHGSRVFLTGASPTSYQIFNPLNKELSFDVDVSQLPCGLNGALYFVEMDADGGMAKYPTNNAGAMYGTGYCDAQCTRDLKFINGQVCCLGTHQLNKMLNLVIG